MTKEQLVEAVSAHDELNALNKIDNFYDYEGDFIKLWEQKKNCGQINKKNGY